MSRMLRALALLVVAAAPASAAEFSLKDGDRVVFYGDSITDQRLYTTFTESYVVTRFPQWKVDFTHSGWGGDRVTGGGGGPIDLRLKRDVVTYRPTVVTIMLGMNDASYRKFDQGIFDIYANGYKHIVDTLKSDVPAVRLTLIGPSPFDDVTRPPTFEGGYNAVLVRYGEFVKDLAGKEGATFADLNARVVEATKKANETDHELAIRLNPDRVHPGVGGQLLMAAALLKGWNAPALVSDVTLDAEGKTVAASENAKVSDLKASEAVSWTQLDAALPMPIDRNDKVVALAVASSPILDELDRQIVRVKGLSAAKYELKIDDKVIGEFTREQLAEGVNLAGLRTPMLEQSLDVHGQTLRHNNLHFTRWRMIQVPLAGMDEAKIKAATDALDSLEADVVAQQRQTAQPKPHAYTLTPKS